MQGLRFPLQRVRVWRRGRGVNGENSRFQFGGRALPGEPMRGSVARKLRRAAGNRGRYRALKRLWHDGLVILGGKDLELRAKPKAPAYDVEVSRKYQAAARKQIIDRRRLCGFARYAPMTKNTAQRKLPVRPDSALAQERRSWRAKRAERWIKR